MLEIVAVFFWARHIGRMVAAKGHRPNSYRWLTAGLWFGGEAIGFVVGAIVTGTPDDLAPIYFFALLGAVSGAAIAWLVAKSLYPLPAGQRTAAPWTASPQADMQDADAQRAGGSQVAGQETPAGQTPVEQTPVGQTPVGQTPAGQRPAWSLPSTPWQPTHVVPQGGMQAWAAPDPSQPPVATLPPGLDLVLERRLGDWAQVRAVNGWSGWVDARLLWERPAATVR